MKNFMIILNVGIILGLASLLSGVSNTTKTIKNAGKPERAESSFTNVSSINNNDDKILEFLMEASEARIMDLEEGKIAQQRATFRALKDYGTLMVEDQSKMLKELQAIAMSKKIKISHTLGQTKADGLSDLKKEHGKEFDSKFIKMMVIDHKRDVKKFEKALSFPDPDIQVFATKYLPVVKSHLDKIQSIKKMD